MKRGQPITNDADQRRAIRRIQALRSMTSGTPYHRNSPSIPAKGQADRTRALSKAAI